MSRARHRITSSSINLHHVRHTYQDETGGPSGDNIYWPIGRGTDGSAVDGDSYLISPNSQDQPACQVGVETYWHDSDSLKLGAGGGLEQLNYQMQANRPIISWDLTELYGKDLKIKSAICHIYASTQIGAQWGGSGVIAPHGAKVYSGPVAWDQKYASWCHYDNNSEWTSLGGGSWDSMDWHDMWTGDDQTAEFECPDINGIPTWFEIDFTSMVDSTLECSNGRLNTLWVRDNDLTPTPIGDLYSGGNNNLITFASGQHNDSNLHPYLVIDAVYCPDCPIVPCP